MHLLHCLPFFSAYFSFSFSAKYIPSALNSTADALSCNNLAPFSFLFPNGPAEHRIPSCLMELVIHTRPDLRSLTWTQLFKNSLPRTRSASGVKWSTVVSIYIYIYMSVVEKKKFESYFRDRLTFSNVDSRTSRRIYRLALLLHAPENVLLIE